MTIRPVASGLDAYRNIMQRRLGDPEGPEGATTIRRCMNEIGEVHSPEQPADQFHVAVSRAQGGRSKMVLE